MIRIIVSSVLHGKTWFEFVVFTSDCLSLSPFFSYLQFFMRKRDFFTSFLETLPFLVAKKSTRKSAFIFVDPEFRLRCTYLGSFVFRIFSWGSLAFFFSKKRSCIPSEISAVILPFLVAKNIEIRKVEKPLYSSPCSGKYVTK